MNGEHNNYDQPTIYVKILLFPQPRHKSEKSYDQRMDPSGNLQ